MESTSILERQELTVSRRAMACEFSVAFPGTARDGVEAGCAALDEVERLEGLLSAYREDSEIGRLNGHAGEEWVGVHAEVYRLLGWCSRLSAATAGAFDPTAGALVKTWGFFRGPKRVPSEGERAAALAACGWRHIRFQKDAVQVLHPDLQFNLGGIGKGYAIDAALRRLQRRFGIRCALMQGGQSSLKAIGTPAGESRGWPVAIGDPLRPDRLLARVRLYNRALGTTSGSNQFFVADGRRYGHVLDPRTGWPAHGLLSASAVAPTATEADALSTAFFVMGLEETRRFCAAHPEYGALLIDRAPRITVMGAIEAEVLV